MVAGLIAAVPHFDRVFMPSFCCLSDYCLMSDQNFSQNRFEINTQVIIPCGSHCQPT